MVDVAGLQVTADFDIERDLREFYTRFRQLFLENLAKLVVRDFRRLAPRRSGLLATTIRARHSARGVEFLTRAHYANFRRARWRVPARYGTRSAAELIDVLIRRRVQEAARAAFEQASQEVL